jgi:hypothetical protein
VSEPRNYSNSSSFVGSTTAVGSVTGTEVTVTRKRGKQCWRTHGTVLAYARAQSFGANETISRRTDGFRTRSMRVCLYVVVQKGNTSLPRNRRCQSLPRALSQRNTRQPSTPFTRLSEVLCIRGNDGAVQVFIC